jgi:aldehyde dehydrogenase (NAD+)
MERYEEYNKSFLDGELVEGETGRTFADQNPYDQSSITTFSLASVNELRKAFETGKEAQKEWRKTKPEVRRGILVEKASNLY